MANDVANFKPTIWSKEYQMNFDNNSVFKPLANRDYEGEVKEAGDTVNVRAFGDITDKAYTRNQTIVWEDLDDPMDTITIDEQRYFAFKLDDLDKAQSDTQILKKYTDRASIATRNRCDQHIHAVGYAGAGASIGSSSLPKVLDKDNVYGYMVDLANELDDLNCPDEGRNVVIPPFVKALLRKSPDFLRDTAAGDKVVQKGYVGEVANMKVFSSTNLNVVSGTTPILAFTSDFITFIDQLTKLEMVRPTDLFADAVKGLHLYKAKVLTNHANCGAVLYAAGS